MLQLILNQSRGHRRVNYQTISSDLSVKILMISTQRVTPNDTAIPFQVVLGSLTTLSLEECTIGVDQHPTLPIRDLYSGSQDISEHSHQSTSRRPLSNMAGL